MSVKVLSQDELVHLRAEKCNSVTVVDISGSTLHHVRNEPATHR